MSAQAVIPLSAESVTLTAGEADNIVFWIRVGDYLYGLTNGAPAKLIRVKRSDFSSRTVLTFANDGKHTNAAGMIHAPSKDRIYCLFGGGNVVITEVNPNTMTGPTDVVDVSSTSVVAGAGALATDDTSLFLLARVSGNSTIIRYALTGFGATTLGLAAYDCGDAVHYRSGKLYVASYAGGLSLLTINISGSMSVGASAAFPSGTDGNGIDFITSSDYYVFVCFEEDTGKVFRFTISGLAVASISTGELDENVALIFDDYHVWNLTDGGIAVRIDPSSNAFVKFKLVTGWLVGLAGDGAYLFAPTFGTSTVIYRFLIPRASPGTTLWASIVGGPVNQYVNGVAVDSSGNAFVCGSDSGNILINKYNSSGALQWTKQFGSGAGNGVAVDSSGNVYMTGFYQGTADFGGGTLTGAGYSDIFVVKFDTNGTLVWQKSFSGSAADAGQAIALDGSGGLYVTGFFTSSINFGGGALGALGGCDIFVIKLTTAAGAHTWSKRFGTADPSETDIGFGIACDSSGNVFVCGEFMGPVDFGGGSLSTNGLDGFLVKFNSAGTHQWSKRFGGVLQDIASAVATSSLGEVVVVGYFAGTINFGGSDLVSHGYSDIFVAKYDANGVHLWSKCFGDAYPDRAYAVAIDRSGNVFVTGRYAGTCDFGNNVILPEAGNDCFVVKLAGANGAAIWGRRWGANATDEGKGIAIDSSGNILVGGNWSGTEPVDFGDGIRRLAGAGDGFLVKLQA